MRVYIVFCYLDTICFYLPIGNEQDIVVGTPFANSIMQVRKT